MENITRALIIAAGILFAIILLSLLLSMHNRISGIADTKEAILEQEQLEEFNLQYEAYNKSVMYGVDFLSLNNKIKQNNSDYPHQIITLYYNNVRVDSITLIDSTGTVVTENNSYTVENFDKKLFKCTKMQYGSSGKVKEIYISDY